MDYALLISFVVTVLGLRVLTATPLTTTTQQTHRSNGRVLVRLEEKIRGMEAMTYAVKLTRMEYILEQLNRRVENMETKFYSMEVKLDIKLEKIEQAMSGNGRHGQINHQTEYVSEKLMNKLSSIEARINVHIDNLNSKMERNERKLEDSLADIAVKKDKSEKFDEMMQAQTLKFEEVNHMQSYLKEDLTEYMSKRFAEIGTKIDNGFQNMERHVETEIHLLKDVKHNVQSANNHLQKAVGHLESPFGSNHSCTGRARDGTEPKVHDDPDISNLTDVMMANMRLGERKFKQLDDDMELYTRKVLNTYQELLKSFREREAQIQQIIRDNNNTRSAVNDAFRRLHQQIRPFSVMQTKMDEMMDGMHHKITELGSMLDSSFASLLIAQNTFITSCHRIQHQEPQIEHKIYALMQQIINRNTSNNSRTNKETSDDLVFSLLNNHHLQMGRALNDMVWTILNNGNRSRDDMQKVMNKINSFQQATSSCMVKTGEWDSLSKACDAVKKSKKVKTKMDDQFKGSASVVQLSRRKNTQRTKSQVMPSPSSASHTFMNDEGDANEKILTPKRTQIKNLVALKLAFNLLTSFNLIMTSFRPGDSKREEFRKYLEKTGILDALTKVLVGLYEEPEKPTDALDYLKKHLGVTPEVVDSDILKSELEEYRKKVEQLTTENLDLKSKDKGQLLFEDKWPSMRPSILKILRQEAVTRDEWQELFWTVHSVCLWDEKGSMKVYQALQEDILAFIKQAQARVLAHSEDQALLKAYIAEWRKFFAQCSYLPMPFGQLESSMAGKNPASGTKKTSDVTIVRKLMLDMWNQSIFSENKHSLQNSAMKLVHAERNGEAFDSQLVIGVRESYVNLCSDREDKLYIYRENFEKAYIEATEAFYLTKAPQYLEANGVQNYMRYADQKLREEEVRAQKYLESYWGSVQALTESCVNVLVTAFKETILAECARMIKQNETEKLQLMFRLMDRVPDGITPMLNALEDHIINACLADMIAAASTIVQDSEKYVEQLLDLFKRFSKLVKEAFNDDPRFLTSRDKAYKQVINDTTVFKLELPAKQKGVSNKTQPESKCPELLANYCDMLLRKTPLSKKLTSDEIESKLKDVLLVLKYVQNKDVFMRYHKAHLTRRLILDTSADSEKEENMVEWLRDVGMPADYVNKLARMFQDIKVSEDLNQQFKELHRSSKGSLADSINIKILNAGAWARASDRVSVSLPMELEDYIPEVEDFYRKKHSGRKLQWHHHMSNGTITFANRIGKFDLDVTTFQMAVLFAWNQRPNDRISLENLRLATELPDAELRKTLWSLLAFPKIKRQIVLCHPEAKSPKDFEDSTLFSMNQEFALIKNGKPQKRGKINLIGRLQLSTERSKEEDNEGIVQLRILRTQEAIVKIMKMRKGITNAQLQTELVEILKNMFLPTKKMIKEQIEWLIEHKYLRRDEENINMFIYMA
uniref:Cullin-5 n=1 Tax=Strigamia maritima TaxID=126957 RepID=T1IY43_STRMM